MKHPAVEFLSDYMVNSFREKVSFEIKGFHHHMLWSLPLSCSGPVFLEVEDSLFLSLKDNSLLNWENDFVLWVPPKEASEKTSPKGFLSYSDISLGLLKTVSGSLWDDVKMVVCASSEKNVIIQKAKLPSFSLTSACKYDNLLNFLSNNNYDRVDFVFQKNQFAVRGGIVDVFPETSSRPIRATFYDSTVLNFFDLDSQLTVQNINKATLPSLSKGNCGVRLIDLVSSKFLRCQIERENVLFLGVGKKSSPSLIGFPFTNLSFKDFTKNHESLKINFLNFKSLFGYLSGSEAFVPRWFSKKTEPYLNNQRLLENKNLFFSSLSIGDFVIHEDCGLGLFVGTKTIKHPDGSFQEQVVIEYDNSGVVYLDVNHLHKLSHHSPKNTEGVLLDDLNKKGLWDRKKNTAKKQAEMFASSLLKAYAKRSSSVRQPYSGDVYLEKELINKFPYEETVDQKRAWEEIDRDLCKSLPMDRLLCGDVGFGKTEIAMRCAFKVVLSQKRVLVLAPTTILTQQLESSFCTRLNPFGVSVSSISRFKSKGSIDKEKELWEKNKTDILIGTHSVLYDDVFLKGASLLIIDEEHRFGVKQKEKIRSINYMVDVLSMSATPIPRTLNLALSGIRSISTLAVPPKARREIKTSVFFFNKKTIYQKISYELSRNGQVFFVHNNVKTLPAIQRLISSLFLFATVECVHGQLPSKTIEKKMSNFLLKKTDVLICTSIIETGIDIPNANTVIINNSHLFGLSQLYQIRGRVGRGDRQAYAYLLVPQNHKINGDAFRRLKAVEQNTRLGSGYNISNLDLEIRGSGALFGYNQSGGVSNVGFELYSHFINKALSSLKEQKQPVFINPCDVSINLFNNCIVPEEYISSTPVRLTYYKRFGCCKNIKEINDLKKELVDRFGPIPQSVKNMFLFWTMKIYSSEIGVSVVEKRRDVLRLFFLSSFVEPCLPQIIKEVESFSFSYSLSYSFKATENGFFQINFNNPNKTNFIKIVFDFLNKFRDVIHLI